MQAAAFSFFFSSQIRAPFLLARSELLEAAPLQNSFGFQSTPFKGLKELVPLHVYTPEKIETHSTVMDAPATKHITVYISYPYKRENLNNECIRAVSRNILSPFCRDDSPPIPPPENPLAARPEGGARLMGCQS